MISPSNIRVNEYRCQDLLAEATRARLIKAAANTGRVADKPASTSRPRTYARHVLAPLANVSFTSRNNKPAAA